MLQQPSIVNYGLHNVLGAPALIPFGVPTQKYLHPGIPTPVIPPMDVPGQGLKRAVCYLADYGGCGFYRAIGPNLLLNLHSKAVIQDSTTMILDPRYYETVEAVKFQRQATPQQKQFVEFVRQATKNRNGKLIYEVDDVVFHEDIPMYNRNRDAFTDPLIRQTIVEIMGLMDEITVTSEYFRDYIINKTGYKNVTALPNYLMKWWFDRYYNLGDLIKKFEKNKKKPIVAIFASGTHVDVINRANQQDDFAGVIEHIIKTRTDFQWHFYGSHPIPLKPFIDRGEIKFFNWAPLPNFPEAMANSGAQVTFAALQDNEFNRCKSNIKLIESGALGLPCVCPDMVTYKDAFLKYSNGNEFIDCLKTVTKNQTVYADFCKKSRDHASKFWLDDDQNLMKHYDSYFTHIDSPERKYLI
jgi:O-antigen biosynthesis protein